MGMKKIITSLVLTSMIVLGSSLDASAASTTQAMFNAHSGNQQGLATNGHYVWVSYDVGGGYAKIATYIWSGRYVGMSKALPLGHAAELDYRVKDGSLYVANGGLESESTSANTKVFRVTLSKGIAQKIVQTYNFDWLGRNGMVAVDNVHDTIVTIGGPDAGPWTLTTHHFNHAARSSALSTVKISDPNVLLQGLAVVNGSTWLYVSNKNTSSKANSRIDVFNSRGVRTAQHCLGFTGEAEGMTVNPLTGSIYIGAHSPNRVMRLHL